MSKVVPTIQITLPEHPFLKKENYTFNGFTCQSCGGTGFIYPRIIDRNEVAPTCSHCGGTGKIKAVVKISYLPDKDIP